LKEKRFLRRTNFTNTLQEAKCGARAKAEHAFKIIQSVFRLPPQLHDVPQKQQQDCFFRTVDRLRRTW
jgi:hypothetical protein